MALEAVVFPQEFLNAGCGAGGGGTKAGRLVCSFDSVSCSCSLSELDDVEEDDLDVRRRKKDGILDAIVGGAAAVEEKPAAAGQQKRRRVRAAKNKEEVETQRRNHIAIERNRRKQMNDYLAVLRSLMPPSYAHRGDQASIVGGAINFVKELEQLLQSLEAQRRTKEEQQQSPFAGFFTFPQYSVLQRAEDSGAGGAVADIEVTMAESHANLKLLSRRRPKQLLKLVVGMQSLRLTPLHLNVTSTAEQLVLYSFNLKVEDDCQLSSADDIAAAVHQMMRRIAED